MKKLLLLLLTISLMGCATSRQYPTYSKKSCHWDRGGYFANMEKVHQHKKR